MAITEPLRGIKQWLPPVIINQFFKYLKSKLDKKDSGMWVFLDLPEGHPLHWAKFQSEEYANRAKSLYLGHMALLKALDSTSTQDALEQIEYLDECAEWCDQYK